MVLLPKADSPYNAGGLARTGVTAEGGFTRQYGGTIKVLLPKAGSPIKARKDDEQAILPKAGSLLSTIRVRDA